MKKIIILFCLIVSCISAFPQDIFDIKMGSSMDAVVPQIVEMYGGYDSITDTGVHYFSNLKIDLNGSEFNSASFTFKEILEGKYLDSIMLCGVPFSLDSYPEEIVKISEYFENDEIYRFEFDTVSLIADGIIPYYEINREDDLCLICVFLTYTDRDGDKDYSLDIIIKCDEEKLHKQRYQEF